MRLNFFVLLAMFLAGVSAGGQNIRWVHPGTYGVAAAGGNYLVTGDSAGLNKVWSLSNSVPKFVRTLPEKDGTWMLSITEDGNTVVTTDDEGEVRAWNVADGSSFVASGPSRFNFAQHHRRRNWLGVLNGGSELRIYDLNTRTNIANWVMDGGGRPFVFSPRDELATFNGGVVRLYSISNGMFREFIFPLSARTEMYRLAFSPDGLKIAASAYVSQLGERFVAIWNTETGDVETLDSDAGLGLEFSPDGNVLATVDSGYDVSFWNVETKALVRRVEFEGSRSMVFLSTNQVLVGNDILTVSTGALVPFIEPVESMHGLQFSDDGNLLATETALLNANTGALLTTFKPWPVTNAQMRAAYIQPIRRSVTPIRFGAGNTITVRHRIFDRTTGEQISQLPIGFPAGLAENWYYTGAFGSTNVAELRRYSDGEILRTLFRTNAGGSSVVGTSPSQALVATFNSASLEPADKIVRLWNSADGSLLREMTNRVQVPYRLAFSSDEKVLAAAAEQYDAEVSVWDVQSGRQIFAGSAGMRPAMGFDLLHGSNFLIWGYDGLNVTDLRTGFTSLAATNEAFQVQTVAVSPDQSRVAFARRDGTIVMMDTPRVDRLSVQSLDGIHALSFLTVLNQNYTLESSGDLKSWSLVTNVVGSGGRFEKEIPVGQTIFYRLRSP